MAGRVFVYRSNCEDLLLSQRVERLGSLVTNVLDCNIVETVFEIQYYCTIGPTFCAVKKEVRRKRKYSDSKVRGKNIAVVYYSAMIAVTRKVHFRCVLLPSFWW